MCHFVKLQSSSVCNQTEDVHIIYLEDVHIIYLAQNTTTAKDVQTTHNKNAHTHLTSLQDVWKRIICRITFKDTNIIQKVQYKSRTVPNAARYWLLLWRNSTWVLVVLNVCYHPEHRQHSSNTHSSSQDNLLLLKRKIQAELKSPIHV